MKDYVFKKEVFFVLLAIIVFLSIPTQSHAQNSSEYNWKFLFNSKDLSGWEKVDGQHKYEIKDGVIVGTEVIGEPNGFLCTNEYFNGFIFEHEGDCVQQLEVQDLFFEFYNCWWDLKKTGTFFSMFQAVVKNVNPT